MITPARVALIGVHGYGAAHRRVMAPLQAARSVELVALCDVRPIADDPDDPVPPGARLFTDYRELLAVTEPDVVVIATPPHTHFEIAIAAVHAGADVLLEKPPFVSWAEHEEFTAALVASGRVCQVGFQALGSASLAELAAAIRAGNLGRVTGIGTYGLWQRPDSYYRRAAWAGRRELDGRPVLDGALANPFAHAVMQSLAVAEAAGPVTIERIELDRYCARHLEVDDTSAVRLRVRHRLPHRRLRRGPEPISSATDLRRSRGGGRQSRTRQRTDLRVVVAVTLCSDEGEYADPRIIVHGEHGRAELDYTADRLLLPGEPARRTVPGRAGLLENLLAHRADPDGVPLLADVARTAPFTRVIEAISSDEAPSPIDARRLATHGAGADRVVTVPGIGAVLRESAEQLRLPRELAVPWTSGPQ